MDYRRQEWNDLIHKDLLDTYHLVYQPLKLNCSFPEKEPESSEYAAYNFELHGLSVKFRAAKITPKKIGAFVTIWKRVNKGPIQPYDSSDSIDLFVVSIRKDHYFGQFVFPKSALLKYGILSKNGSGGKRAIRVYPPWDKPISAQAKKTQNWQQRYFLEIREDQEIDHRRVHALYGPYNVV